MKKRRTYFTLLELLVVIAVIAILASLLLPALRQAKEKARQIQCAGNLRQVSLSVFNYMSDFNGYILHPEVTIGSGNDSSPDYVWSYTLYLNKYVGNPNVFKCPAEKVNGYRSTRTYGLNNGRKYASPSYGIVGEKTVNVQEVSETILLSEVTGLALNHNLYDGTYMCYVQDARIGSNNGTPLHGAMLNFTMCDGHVETQKIYAAWYEGNMTYPFGYKHFTYIKE